MPRPPHVSPAVAGMRGSVYSSLLHRLASHRGEVYPFHVGDTWKSPPAGCRMEDLLAGEHPRMHQYTPPQGLPELVELLVERTRARTGVAVERENLLVNAGATSGLAVAVGALLSPGDEVLILAPHWPLIDGIVRTFGGTPVPVPFFGVADSPQTAVDVVRERLTPRTVALYVNTPNNPSGRIAPRAWLEALAELARREDLWLFFDEVYEDYVYDGEHAYGFALAPERSFSAHSLSKAYGMAGNRCGWLAGPAGPMKELLKVFTHVVYSAPTPSQLAALRVLGSVGDEWIRSARKEYAAVGRKAAARLGLPPPSGSTFLFLDAAPALGERGLLGFLEACADDGLFAAPGTSFGPYPTHLRICYTAAPPDVVARGVEILARHLGR